MSSSYREELNGWLEGLPVVAKRVLDIGGSQEPAKGRTASWSVEEYVIADMENPHKDSPKPDVIIDLNGYAPKLAPFDVIFCLEVFEYVYDPVNAFHIISNLLKKGGSAFVSFPFVYPVHQPIEDDALRYAPGGIEKLAALSGMEIVSMVPRRPRTDFLETFYRHEGLRAAKGLDHMTTGWLCEFTK
jgi:SAM-dependent methyltransferase